jgi:hypothetical protein
MYLNGQRVVVKEEMAKVRRPCSRLDRAVSMLSKRGVGKWFELRRTGAFLIMKSHIHKEMKLARLRVVHSRADRSIDVAPITPAAGIADVVSKGLGLRFK